MTLPREIATLSFLHTDDENTDNSTVREMHKSIDSLLDEIYVSAVASFVAPSSMKIIMKRGHDDDSGWLLQQCDSSARFHLLRDVYDIQLISHRKVPIFSELNIKKIWTIISSIDSRCQGEKRHTICRRYRTHFENENHESECHQRKLLLNV
mmetsp:Transcript_15059/g.18885  ORF Transcript_15059/g.18885 Transcript_15059/m.18885 type:complete len:152 (+) Transcript_15059:118-573(+)